MEGEQVFIGGPPGSPRSSTASRPCDRCSRSSNKSCSSSASSRTSSTRPLGRHRIRTRLDHCRRAHSSSRQSRSTGYRPVPWASRTDAHEVPRGHGRGEVVSARTHAPLRGATNVANTISTRSSRSVTTRPGGVEAVVPKLARQYHPIRTTIHKPKRASKRSPRPTRSSRTRTARQLRPLRIRRRCRGNPFGAGSVQDIFDMFFGDGRSRATARGPSPDRTPRSHSRSRSMTPPSARPKSERHAGASLQYVRRIGLRARNLTDDVRGVRGAGVVQRVRNSILGRW